MAFSSILTTILSVIPRILPDKDKQQEAISKALELERNGELVKLEAASKNVLAEIKSESWLARNWRPITMMMFVYMIFNNHIIVQYARALGINIPMLPISHDMWMLLTVGLGGYVLSRGAEKTAKFIGGKSLKNKV